MGRVERRHQERRRRRPVQVQRLPMERPAVGVQCVHRHGDAQLRRAHHQLSMTTEKKTTSTFIEPLWIGGRPRPISHRLLFAVPFFAHLRTLLIQKIQNDRND